MIEVVTAPEHRYFPPKSLKVFLAGGICKCILWQEMIIKKFLNDESKVQLSPDFTSLYILNPRRVDWIEKPGEAIRQIEWEFDMIEKCDVFTMYFAGGESDQPICMYELGRNIERMKERFPESWKDRIIITCDSSYKRLNDVQVQTRLATDDLVKPIVVEPEGLHTHNIDGLTGPIVVDGATESVNAHYSAIKSKLKYIYLR